MKGKITNTWCTSLSKNRE